MGPVDRMAHFLQLIDAHKLAIISYRDSVSASEIGSVFDALLDLARAHPGLAAIADFRGCQLTFSTEELRALASQSQDAALAAGPAKWAILAADDLTFGLGRMYSAFASNQPVETRTFRDVASLAEWFGLEAAEVEEWLTAAAGKAVDDQR
ncbi:MAG: hypothetical protein RLT05_11695 [Bauldia litoralis]